MTLEEVELKGAEAETTTRRRERVETLGVGKTLEGSET
jgi:hypothetical protein